MILPFNMSGRPQIPEQAPPSAPVIPLANSYQALLGTLGYTHKDLGLDIKVDIDIPTFGWQDLLGALRHSQQ